MNAVIALIVCCGSLVGALPSGVYAAPAAYAQPMTYAQPMAYAQSAYAAPSYDVSDVTKIVDYDYAVNDYYGNEQTRQEHVEPGKQVGSWTVRLADGAKETVTYEANDYGNLAHVVIHQGDYATPAYSAPVKTYSAPSYSAPVQTYSAPAYSAPVQTYAAPSYPTPTYVAPKMHYNYEEKNIYVPQTYAAPQKTYVAPKMHYNYEEQNMYVPQTYAAPMTYHSY